MLLVAKDSALVKENENGRKIVVIDEHTPHLAREALANDDSLAVVTTSAALDGINAIKSYNPDLIVTEARLSGIADFAIINWIREYSENPIIVASYLSDQDYKLKAFRLGADDYLVKPYYPEELAARVRAIMRRVNLAQAKEPIVHCGDVAIDLDRRIVHKGNRPVRFTRSEWKLLQFLVQYQGRFVLNSEILTRVWGDAYRNDIQYLRVWVFRIRAKLEDDPANPKIIVNIPGIGYKFESDSPSEQKV